MSQFDVEVGIGVVEVVEGDALDAARRARQPPVYARAVQGRVRDVFLRGRHAVVAGRLADDLPTGRYLPCGAPDTEVR